MREREVELQVTGEDKVQPNIDGAVVFYLQWRNVHRIGNGKSSRGVFSI